MGKTEGKWSQFRALKIAGHFPSFPDTEFSQIFMSSSNPVLRLKNKIK
jgi:hypothetical protein